MSLLNREIVQLISSKGGIASTAKHLAEDPLAAHSDVKSITALVSRINKRKKELARSRNPRVASTVLAYEAYLDKPFVFPKKDPGKSHDRYHLFY